MPLPKLVVSEYEMKIPSTKETIKYRPFLVKEEKLLLTAMELGGEKEMINAVKTIIKNCTNLKGRVDSLATFDIEYIFLRIRAKSVGEVSKVMVTCPDDNETQVQIEINLEDIEIVWPENHKSQIELDDDTYLVMNYPSLDTFVKINFTGEDVGIDTVFDLAGSCIQQIVQGDEVYDVKNYTKKEVVEFLESLKSDQFMKLQSFFSDMPRLEHEVEVKNPETGVESTVKLEGLGAFFE
ncbi:baseplate hub subunit [Synechococcus phage S-H38]|uniref:Baseplate hub subunit n=1 Tax=Synechococcus phage S-H38 TaxID=2783673 RepID=A0A873WG46_9CAUD|nr:baseplate hub [Synechococcus phage S-H38]QPB07892.1 baseplate hub subunit [Synechococcus phage S-H38]